MDLLGTPSYILNPQQSTKFYGEQKMITQERVWNAIDKIAKLKGLSLMGLSKASGLDYGVLAKSRRMLPYGIVHYPSMTTIQKVLSATDISFIEFAKMVEENAES